MPEPRTFELIQSRIDNALDPAGRAELDAILSSDDEARKLDADYGRLNELLEGVPAEEPPGSMVEAVMARVRSETRNAPVQFVDRRSERERRRSIVARFGLGLAAVLAAAFVLVPSLRNSVDPRHASGTMIEQQLPGTTREIPMRGSQISGTIRVTTAGDRVALDFAFDGEATRDVRAAFDPAQLSIELPEGIAGAPASPFGAGFVSVEPEGGRAALRFVRKGEGAARVSLSVVQGDDFFETTIELPK
ncbi:MAG: hypothetical protein WC538_14965 [Thermoanaerobaculia bacterium]|jgi:hypothetical protein